jgi:hypothetical protein
MKKIILLLVLFATSGFAQIKVDPNGVNVSVNGATTVFLTFGGLVNQAPVEAIWCGALIPAAPDIGMKPDPNTIFGRLPLRYDLSSTRNNAFTDIMSIPPSVARRAYQAALEGADSRFFYVRRFASTTGGPDEYVAVTCRLAGGGARVPFALLDVKLAFKTEATVLSVKQDEKLPPLAAEIAYNGTGILKGRWDVVRPGEEPPTAEDLLTEATLPVEERGLQKRYTELSRFNVFLPPTGKYTLAGPDAKRLPSDVEGLYMVLLRVEVSDDKEGNSSFANAGAGQGVVHSGAVAGFPLPPLRYFVGSITAQTMPVKTGEVQLLAPADSTSFSAAQAITFSWLDVRQAAVYQLEIQDTKQQEIFSAMLQAGVTTYRAPSWLKDKTSERNLRWSVKAVDLDGNTTGESSWRVLKLVEP